MIVDPVWRIGHIKISTIIMFSSSAGITFFIFFIWREQIRTVHNSSWSFINYNSLSISTFREHLCNTNFAQEEQKLDMFLHSSLFSAIWCSMISRKGGKKQLIFLQFCSKVFPTGGRGLLIIKGFCFFRKEKFPVSGIGKWIFVMSSPTKASCFFSRIDLIYLFVHCGWTHGLINGPVNDCGGYS